MARLALLACCLLPLTEAADLKPDELRLAQTRERMAVNLAKLPNYTCTQTTERLERSAHSNKLRLRDIIRLEVALVDGRELFAWPGSSRFEDRELRHMVGSGMTGNGQFGLFAQAIFLSRVATFTFLGERIRADRPLLRWDFEVPQNMSGYLLRDGLNEAVVAYRGSFWADPTTLELKRLEVKVDDVPRPLTIRSAAVGVDYASTRIGTRDFLLPGTAELELTDDQGRSSINRTRFAGCRQYLGQSRLVFEDSEATPDQPQAAAPMVIEVPADVKLDVSLLTPVQAGRAIIGDPLTFSLRKATPLGNGIVAPKGALVHGRLTMLREPDHSTQPGLIGMEINEIEFGNVRGELRGLVEGLQSVALGRRPLYSLPPLGMERAYSGTPEGASVLLVNSSPLSLMKGTVLFWRTTKASANAAREN